MTPQTRVLLCAALVFVVLAECAFALPKPVSSSKKDEETHSMTVSIDIDKAQFLEEHDKFDPEKVHVKNFPLETLTYLTPWYGLLSVFSLSSSARLTNSFLLRNRIGFEWAMTFRSKFTYLSPVWYGIKPTMELEGSVLAETFQVSLSSPPSSPLAFEVF